MVLLLLLLFPVREVFSDGTLYASALFFVDSLLPEDEETPAKTLSLSLELEARRTWAWVTFEDWYWMVDALKEGT